jgi:hypothetical protein
VYPVKRIQDERDENYQTGEFARCELAPVYQGLTSMIKEIEIEMKEC